MWKRIKCAILGHRWVVEGERQADMPIAMNVGSQADYDAWLATSKKKFAAIENDATRVASK